MKTLITLFTILAAYSGLLAPQLKAQTLMHVKMNDGSTLTLPADSIVSIGFEQDAPATLEGLTGQWQLIAMPNGTTSGGISTATADTISFTASIAPDGRSLACHADAFYTRTGQVYPADWTIVVEQDEATGRRRLGWVLSDQQPASALEFNEQPSQYLEDGFFYWGNGTEAHHYIYLLSENIETQRLEAMTLWSAWQGNAQTTYTLPQNQEVYGVVGTAIPYQPGTSVGYFEIWASPRFVKTSAQ